MATRSTWEGGGRPAPGRGGVRAMAGRARPGGQQKRKKTPGVREQRRCLSLVALSACAHLFARPLVSLPLLPPPAPHSRPSTQPWTRPSPAATACPPKRWPPTPACPAAPMAAAPWASTWRPGLSSWASTAVSGRARVEGRGEKKGVQGHARDGDEAKPLSACVGLAIWGMGRAWARGLRRLERAGGGECASPPTYPRHSGRLPCPPLCMPPTRSLCPSPSQSLPSRATTTWSFWTS